MLLLYHTSAVGDQKQMANSAKRALANISFGLPFILFPISCITSVLQFIFCKQFRKFMYLPDSPDLPVGYSGNVAGNHK